MTRSTAIPLAGGVLLAGALAAGVLFGPLGSTQAGVDGGAALLPAQASYQLPDGATWPYPPDAGKVAIDPSCGAAPGLQTCTVLDPVTGTYQRFQVFVPADGGQWLYSSNVGLDCVCASDAGPCAFSDGGPVPPTGSYSTAAYGAMTGAGCVARSCEELSGLTGAPVGCSL
jgi:hypothetical protein